MCLVALVLVLVTLLVKLVLYLIIVFITYSIKLTLVFSNVQMVTILTHQLKCVCHAILNVKHVQYSQIFVLLVNLLLFISNKYVWLNVLTAIGLIQLINVKIVIIYVLNVLEVLLTDIVLHVLLIMEFNFSYYLTKDLQLKELAHKLVNLGIIQL